MSMTIMIPIPCKTDNWSKGLAQSAHRKNPKAFREVSQDEVLLLDNLEISLGQHEMIEVSHFPLGLCWSC